VSSFWRSGADYDIESESNQLSWLGEPFLIDYLRNENLNYRKPLTVDFGCWSGRHLQLLERVANNRTKSDSSSRVIGIDEPFAKERLNQARRAYRHFSIFDEGIGDTGLPPSSVDAGISWRVLHNLIKPGEWSGVISEIRRVLKHGAPLVIAVRAAQDWMPQKAPVPLLYRTFSFGIDRDDLYFSENACYAIFRFYGFDIPYQAEKFSEEEIIDGTRVKNDYWMLTLVCNKRGSYLRMDEDEVPFSSPVAPEFREPPSSKLTSAYN
jgi:SAM-dependent methyltransferase